MIKKPICLICLVFSAWISRSQNLTVAQIKSEMAKSPNSPLYVKQVLKKKFKIDTIIITRTNLFHSLADSIGYNGKINAVFGPYTDNGRKFLVQVLAKSPNVFYHVSQIFIDTTLFSLKFIDSLGNVIVEKIRRGQSTFEQMAKTYSMGGEGPTEGDLGWVARGVLFPQIEKEVVKRKKNEVFKVWTTNGLHILKRTDDPKQDTGFALLMRVFL